jgi:phosphoribosylformimino-5-aminoimidazole carboxamide ribotide isomerase
VAAVNKCRIVPAIDLIDGKCVRLESGAFDTSSVVAEDPVTTAKRFEEEGFGRLHLVDLTGAKSGEPRHLEVLQAISTVTSLSIDYSGGLRTDDSIRHALEAGAAKVVIGSAAVTKPDETSEWFDRFGGEVIVLALDVLDGYVRVHGWTQATTCSIDDVVQRYLPHGLQALMSTDIRRDGMLEGPAMGMYAELRMRYPALQLIASGGV